MSTRAVPILCTFIAASCCAKRPNGPAEAPATSHARAEIGSVYTLKIIQSDEGNVTIEWNVRVNTGGYALKTDHVDIEERDGRTIAHVFATLEQPGDGEMVTQAITTVTARYDAGAKRIDQVELSVRRTVRGQSSDAAAYSIVQRTGDRP